MNWNSKINPFGNFDDPIPPDWYAFDVSEWIVSKKWLPHWNWFVVLLIYLGWFFWRNPAHNFMHHWLGFRSRQHLTNYNGNIWNEKSKWNIVLPFISYRSGNFEAYVGWRPDTKAFGIAWRYK